MNSCLFEGMQARERIEGRKNRRKREEERVEEKETE